MFKNSEHKLCKVAREIVLIKGKLFLKIMYQFIIKITPFICQVKVMKL